MEEKREGPYSRRPGESIPKDEETVVAKAWRYDGRDDQVYTGDDHVSVYNKMEGVIPDFDRKKVESGFTTSTGRFVVRDEGIDILARKGKTIDKM